MSKSGLRCGATFAVGLLVVLACAITPLAVAKNKNKGQQPGKQSLKNEPGVDQQFAGIMDPNKQVKMSDPLWERYMYAGKKQLERRDIAQAQRYFWAADFAWQDYARKNPKVKLNDIARNTLIDAFALSGDIFFEDPDSASIRNDPPAFAQEILPADKPLVDGQLKRLDDEQNAFDVKHGNFDGGARLRLRHLRRRIEFAQQILPALNQLLGGDDEITKQLTVINNSDTAEYKDLSGE